MIHTESHTQKPILQRAVLLVPGDRRASSRSDVGVAAATRGTTQRRVERERHDRNEPWGGPMSSGIDARTDGYPNAAPKAQGAGKSPASLVLACVMVHSLGLPPDRCP